jgi:hypothetical protein
MPTENVSRPPHENHLAALIAALLLLGLLIGFVNACSDEDLIFPADVPFTPTSQFTATPAPTEDEDDI